MRFDVVSMDELNKYRTVNNYLCAAGFVFLVVAGLGNYVKPVSAYQATAASQEAARKRAVASAEAPSPSTKSPVAGDNQNPAIDKIKRSEWVQIFISGFVALVVLWQGWIYSQQRKATRIAEGGYIGIKTMDMLDFEPGKIPIIQIAFLNGGRTPVWNLYTPGGFNLSKEPPDDWEPLPVSPEEAGAFLVAGETGTVRWLSPVPMNCHNWGDCCRAS